MWYAAFHSLAVSLTWVAATSNRLESRVTAVACLCHVHVVPVNLQVAGVCIVRHAFSVAWTFSVNPAGA